MTKRFTAFTLIVVMLISILMFQTTALADEASDLDLSVLSNEDETTSYDGENYS